MPRVLSQGQTQQEYQQLQQGSIELAGVNQHGCSWLNEHYLNLT